MKNKKVNVVVEGIKMNLPAESILYRNDGVTPYIYAGRVIAGSIVKQFVKAKYPNVVCTTKSASFANGNSLDVYVSNPNGSEVDEVIYSDINRFANIFQYGKFNGMTDMYEGYSNTCSETEQGTPLEAGVKYVMVSNKPTFGSVGDCVRMLRDMTEGKYVWGVISMEKAIEKVLNYKVSQSNIDKALIYLK
jgi:hypothetical protein